ncbi:YheC/YheD family protein [Paenibacillus sp. YN15]|uniref:YheC/YheD family endospore coat-associated protein n=1 Tax=Paenibacillus sp. YN15 TaxID=1742774 RepID=UPI000DCBBF5F|nr:YheC/YheD family protein [Paenibacillus sp. YN15]RAV06558.1 YheC/YheD family protein [Paenibacillus sp. YN15]
MKHQSSKPRIGVMAGEFREDRIPPFGETRFYESLCAAGHSCGAEVYVFSPLDADEAGMTVTGYGWSPGGGWKKRSYPLPDLIYDRAFFSSKEAYQAHRQALRRLGSLKQAPYLGFGLKSKWEMLHFLRRDPALRPYLPQTAKVAAPEDAARWLSREQRIFLKPASGSQGKGTVMAEQAEEGGCWRVRARDSANQPIALEFRREAEFVQWLGGFMGRRAYLMQPYLELAAPSGEAWDIRALVQKNGRGLWELTGMGARVGASGSITSNLHGGGSAVEVDEWLERQFGAARSAEILRTLRMLAKRIPAALEACNGRMAELGLDLGVDREGRVWIIEANTKPGRSIFRKLGQEKLLLQAERNPIAYACYILTRTSLRPDGRQARAKPLICLP